MNRRVGWLNLLQAGVYFAGAFVVGGLWLPAAIVLVGCGISQLVVASASGGPARARLAQIASVVTLVGLAILLGMFVQAALHLIQRFGPHAGRMGYEALLFMVLVLPYAVALPLWQVWTGRQRGLRSGARPELLCLVGLGLPLAWGAGSGRAVASWPAQPELSVAAEGALARWQGRSDAVLPAGNGPAVVLLTPWRAGEPGTTALGSGPDLAGAVEAALAQLPPEAADGSALVLDLARTRWAGRGLVPVGDGGGLGEGVGLSPGVAWHGRSYEPEILLPRLTVPRLQLGALDPARFDSVVAGPQGVWELSGGWVAPPALSAESVLEAARLGGHMVMRNLDDKGRYAYIIRGPSGTPGAGYSLPRHAGTTWFLARLAARLDDAELAAAADLALGYLARTSTWLPDGSAYVATPRRKDGRAWVGTTALTVLAAVAREHPLTVPWGRTLARSVDAQGQVRGELLRDTGEFPEQSLNSYGQGQTVLALAALVRAGHTEFRPALERAAGFFDGGYAPLGSGRLIALDEHWTCIAALVVQDVQDVPAGMGLCRAYLRGRSPATPAGVFRPSTAAAGGVAEAVVAAAVLDPEGPWRARALRYGELFIGSVYRSADRAFLSGSTTLLGGYRSSPLELDVQIDTVQHVGCALLGIEGLLSGSWRAGALP